MGLNVDEECALAVITRSEVVSRRESTKNADLRLILEEFEEWFGVSLHKPFELFNVFNGTKNLLFEVSFRILHFTRRLFRGHISLSFIVVHTHT